MPAQVGLWIYNSENHFLGFLYHNTCCVKRVNRFFEKNLFWYTLVYMSTFSHMGDDNDAINVYYWWSTFSIIINCVIVLCLCQYVDVLKPERQARRGTRKALCGGGLRALAAWPRGSEAPALDPASMHFTSQLTYTSVAEPLPLSEFRFRQNH